MPPSEDHDEVHDELADEKLHPDNAEDKLAR
jgi:hypothetical protein